VFFVVESVKTWLREKWKRWRQVISTSGFEGVLIGAGIVSGVLTARLLMPSGKGALTAVLLWPSFFGSVVAVGTGQGVIYYAGGDKYELGVISAGLLSLTALQGLLVAVSGWFAIPWILQNYSDSTIWIARLLFLWAPIARLYGYGLRILQGIGEYRVWNIIRVGRQVLYSLTIVVLWFLGWVTVERVIWGYLLAEGLGTLATITVIASHVEQLKINVSFIWELLTYGFQNFLGSLTQKGNKRLDQAIMSAWLSPEALGLYRVAVSTTRILTPLSAGFKKVLIAEVSRSDDDGDSKRMIGETYRAALPIMAVSSVAGALLMPFAVPLMFGAEYQPAVWTAMILCVAGGVWGMNNILFNAARGEGKPIIPFYCELVGLVITGIGLYFLLPLWGIEGAAVASLAAYSGTMAMGYALIQPNADSD
jgi:O-antigen/teichoic acid export membrane protein